MAFLMHRKIQNLDCHLYGIILLLEPFAWQNKAASCVEKRDISHVVLILLDLKMKNK